MFYQLHVDSSKKGDHWLFYFNHIKYQQTAVKYNK